MLSSRASKKVGMLGRSVIVLALIGLVGCSAEDPHKTVGQAANAITGFFSSKEKNESKDIFWSCEGTWVGKRGKDNVVSSFYIGKDFIEQEGTRFQICAETKTTIRFADKCVGGGTSPLSSGNIDLVLRRVLIEDSLTTHDGRMQIYGDCVAVPSPRK